MLLATLFLYPDYFTSMLLLHPMLPIEPPQDLTLSGKNIFVSYGRDDAMITPEQSRRVASVLTARDATVALHEYSGGHGIHQEEITDLTTMLLKQV